MKVLSSRYYFLLLSCTCTYNNPQKWFGKCCCWYRLFPLEFFWKKKDFQGMLCTQLQENTDVSKQEYRPGYAHFICCILHWICKLLHVHGTCCPTLIIYFMSVITKTVCSCFIGMYYISTKLYYMTIVHTVSFDFIFARQLNKEM